jgi:hypothetical protein
VNFAVTIMDQEPHPFEQAGEAEVASLLNDPGSGRVRCATGEVDTPAAKLDEEEHVEAAQPDRLDGEEVAGEHARGLLSKERGPTQLGAPWRWLKPSRGKQTPDRARREAKTKLDHFTGDPLITPARVLSRQPQHQFARGAAGWRTSWFALRVRPLSAHQLPVPAQQRRWRYNKSTLAPVWE